MKDVTRMLELKETLSSFWYSDIVFTSLILAIIFIGCMIIFLRTDVMKDDDCAKSFPLVVAAGVFSVILLASLFITSNSLNQELNELEGEFFFLLAEDKQEAEGSIYHSVEIPSYFCKQDNEFTPYIDKCFYILLETENGIEPMVIKSKNDIRADDTAVVTVTYVKLTEEHRTFFNELLDASIVEKKFGLDLDKWNFGYEIRFE